MTYPSTTIKLNAVGADLAVEICGTGAESVLFVHGLGANRSCWYRAKEFFDLERYRLVLPDLPGFGDSERPEGFDYTMASLGNCLGSVVSELGLRRPHVIAHSMGCVAALSMVQGHALRPASFTAAEGNLIPTDAFMSSKIARFTEQDFVRSYTRWVAVMHGFWGSEPNEQHERFIASLRTTSPIAMYRASVSCNNATRAGALAGQFASQSCALAYVYGAKSPKERPMPEVVFLPKVQRFAVEGQGHFMMQAAELFYPWLRAFIASNRPPDRNE